MKYDSDVPRYLVYEDGFEPKSFDSLDEAKARILQAAKECPGCRFAVYAPIWVAGAKITPAKIKRVEAGE